MRSPAFILTSCLLMCGCSDVKDESTSGKPGNRTTDQKPVVIVTSQPLFEVADLLAGDHMEVQKITPDNIASRNWKPGKGDVQRLQKADMILISGAGYESWMDRVALPGSRLRDTAAGYYSEFIRIPDAITHQHGPEGKHAHPGTVWATWLDPKLAESQCARVADLLTELKPDASREISAGITKIRTHLAKTQNLATKIFAATSAQKIKVAGDNPHYYYLTKHLGWDFQYVQWDESQQLTALEEDELSVLAEKRPKGQPQLFLLNSLHAESTARFVTDAGFTVIRIDLCEYPAPQKSPDTFFDRLHSNFARISTAVGSH